MNPKVSVIILNYNSCELTINFVKSFRRKIIYEPLEIIIVDNCSTNHSIDYLENYEKQLSFKLLTAFQNRGYAAGNNIGLQYAFNSGSAFGLVVNNDIEIINQSTDFIESLLKPFVDKSIAAVSPRIYTKTLNEIPPFLVRPSFWDLSFGCFFYRRRRYKYRSNKEYSNIYRPAGCCMMVKLEDMNKCNYMDEHTFLYSEEEILAERLSACGKKCACARNVKIVHHHSTTIKNECQRKQICSWIMESYKYYLIEYRRFNVIQISICLLFKRIIERLKG